MHGCNQDGHEGWRSLSNHLVVRNTREDDPEAELMVSALVPTFALTMAPPALTELELRIRDSMEVLQAPKDVLKKLGGLIGKKVVYGSDLANVDQTAILTPGAAEGFVQGGAARRRIACPMDEVPARPKTQLPRTLTRSVGRSSAQTAVMHRFIHGGAAVHQSTELIN